MFVVAIRQFGADEVSEVVGPFETWDAAHEWCPETADGEDDPEAWYDIHELTKPVTKGN